MRALALWLARGEHSIGSWANGETHRPARSIDKRLHNG
jgi:hypothetical protein